MVRSVGSRKRGGILLPVQFVFSTSLRRLLLLPPRRRCCHSTHPRLVNGRVMPFPETPSPCFNSLDFFFISGRLSLVCCSLLRFLILESTFLFLSSVFYFLFSFLFLFLIFIYVYFLLKRNSISPTEREKYRNARSPMSSGDPHAPDMKKIKREDKDGHVRKHTATGQFQFSSSI